MARITVEDCLERIPNLFDLVLTASKRARRLANGAEAMVEWENDKPTVVALREIADGHIDIDILEENEQQQALEAVFEDETPVESQPADQAPLLAPAYTRPAPSSESAPSSEPAPGATAAPEPAAEAQPAETAQAETEELTSSDLEAELGALMSAQPEQPTAAEPETEAPAESAELVETEVQAEAAESAEPDTQPESSSEAQDPDKPRSTPPGTNPPE